MTYEETLHYLYTSTPVFQHSGASAYKPGLGTSIALDNHLGNPHKAYKTIHIAGTNGKGSVSHLLAATLMQAGYTVGLYTSPHLIDFRERIRVNEVPLHFRASSSLLFRINLDLGIRLFQKKKSRLRNHRGWPRRPTGQHQYHYAYSERNHKYQPRSHPIPG